MPWKTTTPMEETLRFVTLAQTERPEKGVWQAGKRGLAEFRHF